MAARPRACTSIIKGEYMPIGVQRYIAGSVRTAKVVYIPVSSSARALTAETRGLVCTAKGVYIQAVVPYRYSPCHCTQNWRDKEGT